MDRTISTPINNDPVPENDFYKDDVPFCEKTELSDADILLNEMISNYIDIEELEDEEDELEEDYLDE